MGFFSWLFRRKKERQIKIGLALGSGGAKGFAELGALKAFEENGIEFDVIAGTSIGSIIGAFYAQGYTSTDIFEMLKRIDFGEIANLIMIRMDTSGLHSVIDRELGSMNIEDLKKPFVTVATEVETGTEKVFDKGNAAIALCASSSYPPFFKPVVIDGERYVDGAFTNAIPADQVKKMGADYIVGIDLSTPENKTSLLMRIIPTYKTDVENPSAKGYEFSNVMLHPDLTGYTSVSFRSGSAMYDIGYKHALKFIPQIKSDIETLRHGKMKK